jgi:hypothetical protein
MADACGADTHQHIPFSNDGNGYFLHLQRFSNFYQADGFHLATSMPHLKNLSVQKHQVCHFPYLFFDSPPNNVWCGGQVELSKRIMSER